MFKISFINIFNFNLIKKYGIFETLKVFYVAGINLNDFE